MSIEFTSGFEKPSNLVALPGNFVRPTFEVLYGFDVPQGLASPSISVVQLGLDGATITTTGVTGATIKE